MSFIITDKYICGGEPVIVNTRYPVSLLLAELADNRSIGDIADDCDLNPKTLRSVLLQLSVEMGKKKMAELEQLRTEVERLQSIISHCGICRGLLADK